MVPTAAARKKERPHPWRVVVKYKTRGKREERRRFRARKKKKNFQDILRLLSFTLEFQIYVIFVSLK